MKPVQYYITDVFTDKKFEGNQLAVFPNAQLIPENLYQIIAREMNLSETTFILPPTNNEADFKLRIFTPDKELPMAGHPTIGTAFVVNRQTLLGKSVSHLVIEEGVGNIPVEFVREGSSEVIWMNQPLPQFENLFESKAKMAEILSLNLEDIEHDLPVQIVNCGVPFIYIPLKTLNAIKKIKVRLDLYDQYLNNFPCKNLFVFTRETERKQSTVHCRMFAPALGITEDPATGGATGPLGSYLVKYGLAKADEVLISEQGFEMNRPSILFIQIQQKENNITNVKVGGSAVLTSEGKLFLD